MLLVCIGCWICGIIVWIWFVFLLLFCLFCLLIFYCVVVICCILWFVVIGRLCSCWVIFLCFLVWGGFLGLYCWVGVWIWICEMFGLGGIYVRCVLVWGCSCCCWVFCVFLVVLDILVSFFGLIVLVFVYCYKEFFCDYFICVYLCSIFIDMFLCWNVLLI